MICLANHRPAIQVADHQVFDYDGVWLAQALSRAAHKANQADFPYIQEIVSGVLEYLDTHYASHLVPLEVLHQRVKKMLSHIGCTAIAEHFVLHAPPVTISLLQTIERADFPAELGFLHQLKDELRALQEAGAHHLIFTDRRETVLALLGLKKWNKKCAQFLLFLDELLHRHETSQAA